MTIYHVHKCYRPDDTIHYIVSPYDLILMGSITSFAELYGIKELLDFLKMSRFSEKRANRLADKMNKLHLNKGDVNYGQSKNQ